jgi:hypothetical protein
MVKDKVRDYRHHGRDGYATYKTSVKTSKSMRIHGKPAVHVDDSTAMCPLYSMLPVYGCYSVINGTCACKLDN